MNTRLQLRWIYVALIVLAIAFVSPLMWAVLTSLKNEPEFMTYPITITPQVIQWQNYVDAFTQIPFMKYFGNSLSLAIIFTPLSVFVSAWVGYGFARLNAPGKRLFFSIVIAMILLPQMITFVPQFILFSRMKLVGTYWPWILWGLAGSPWHIFLFRQFFSGFPKELEDAAEVDGCGRFRIFWQIVLPNSIPALITSAIFNFQWVWSDWLNPALLLNDDNTTLAVKLTGSTYVDPHGTIIVTTTMAAVVLYILPMVVLFFIAQRYIVENLVASGLKG